MPMKSRGFVHFFLLFNLIMCTCASYRYRWFAYGHEGKSGWINSYKYEAFCGCMQAGLGNDSLKLILQNRDLFRPDAAMDFATADEARALGKAVIDSLPPPYSKVDPGEEALRLKNFISYSCLNYHASRELDRLARKKYTLTHPKK